MAHVLLGRKRQLARQGLVEHSDGFVQRSGVHANADGNAGFARSVQHSVGLAPSANIAGVDAQLRGAAARSLDGDVRIKVDVGDNGKRRRLTNCLERVQAIAARDGHAHDLAAGVGKRVDLRQVRLDIGGRRVQHRLHDHGSSAAHGHAAHHHPAGRLVGFRGLRLLGFHGHLPSVASFRMSRYCTATNGTSAGGAGRSTKIADTMRKNLRPFFS